MAVIGPRVRLAGTAGLSMTKGSEGFILHGGGTPELEHMREVFHHRFENGRMKNGLVSVSYTLSDVGSADGGFVCIPGSHKANYLCPIEVRRLEVDLGCVEHVPMKAGDAVIFTEALLMGLSLGKPMLSAVSSAISTPPLFMCMVVLGNFPKLRIN